MNNYQIQTIGRWGDVVRIGPTHVLVYDPEAIDTIFGFRERLDKVRKALEGCLLCFPRRPLRCRPLTRVGAWIQGLPNDG